MLLPTCFDDSGGGGGGAVVADDHDHHQASLWSRMLGMRGLIQHFVASGMFQRQQ
jgi:hypothetical protein